MHFLHGTFNQQFSKHSKEYRYQNHNFITGKAQSERTSNFHKTVEQCEAQIRTKLRSYSSWRSFPFHSYSLKPACYKEHKAIY